MKRSKLMVIGGFLGAGKTTSMIEIENVLKTIGQKVALITNDQTAFQVDTHYVETQKIPVEEVSGSCFCCNFDKFKEVIEKLQEEDTHFILAEPVGSCTDLVSTIMKPIKMGKAGNVEILPLSVVVEPRRLMDLMNQDTSLLSKDVYYLFSKQMEEADIIILNKLDTISVKDRKLLKEFLEITYPTSQILEISAREGTGIEKWLLAVLCSDQKTTNIKKINLEYDTYANAEAEMGWLNANAQLNAENLINGNDILFDLGKKIKDLITQSGGEIGHLKLFLKSEGEASKISCVGVNQPIDVASEFTKPIKNGDLIINIRATVSPEELSRITQISIKRLEEAHKLEVENFEVQAFRPSYPTPTYRY